MRQAQSHRPRPAYRASRTARRAGAWSASPHRPYREGRSPILAGVAFLFRACWWIVTLPFRLTFGVIALAGRLMGVAIGFALMVLGAALGAGPFYLIGIPVFLVGLLMTLRSLG